MCNVLSGCGIPCTYVQMSTLNYVMQDVTKVLLGAHAMLANGYMQARAGNAMVAMAAQERGIPVIVCCERLQIF